MTRDVMSKYIQESKKQVFFVTQGAKEGLLIPFNYTFVESTSKSDGDIVGYRLLFFFQDELDEMSVANRWLIATRKPNAFLQNAVEVLEKEAPE
jgi:hypothetical protein